MAPAIPDRWIPYKPCGKVIEGTRIICFKVPLAKKVQHNVKEIKTIWDIQTLVSKIPKLGAVIDLTNTNRYYKPQELEDAGVVHKKILMPGRIIPPEDKVIEFMDTVDEFLGKDCDLVVGVHCTHGLNRTGYMVCRYMRDRLNIPAKTAIKRFETARGYQIERENYICKLMGKDPPPPVFGKETIVKPSHREKTDVRYRSPLDYCEEEQSRSRTRDRYTRSRRDRHRNRRTSSSDGRDKSRSREYNYVYDY